jgi:hypothetical protein
VLKGSLLPFFFTLQDFKLGKKHDSVQAQKAEAAAIVEENFEEEEKKRVEIKAARERAKVCGPPRELNKPIYEGVCSHGKRYSVLLGTSGEKFGQPQNNEQNNNPSSASMAKPTRVLNSPYKGTSQRRYSRIMGQSTNARSKANKQIASMGRPANRWTADGPLKKTSRLPRLPQVVFEEAEEKKNRWFSKKQKKTEAGGGNTLPGTGKKKGASFRFSAAFRRKGKATGAATATSRGGGAVGGTTAAKPKTTTDKAIFAAVRRIYAS